MRALNRRVEHSIPNASKQIGGSANSGERRVTLSPQSRNLCSGKNLTGAGYRPEKACKWFSSVPTMTSSRLGFQKGQPRSRKSQPEPLQKNIAVTRTRSGWSRPKLHQVSTSGWAPGYVGKPADQGVRFSFILCIPALAHCSRCRRFDARAHRVRTIWPKRCRQHRAG